MTMRSGTTIIEVARDIMAAAVKCTGERASGKVLVRSKAGAGNVYLPQNWHFIPIINGAAREELLFKVARGPNRAKYPDGKRQKTSEDEPDAPSWWVVTEAGTLVDVISVIGGHRHNLPAGTKMVFDPLHSSFEPEVEVGDGGTTGGVDPTHLGGCMSMTQFEQMTGPSATLDAFRASIDKYPAAVICWDGSEPADGTTQSSLDRGATRVGPGEQLFKERFNIFVLSSRLDGDHMRRNEGLKLLDDLSFWLTDATSADDQIFSTPGVQIRGRARVAGQGEAYQALYVYVIQLSVTLLWKRYDDRTFNPWLLARSTFLTHDKDADDERKEVVGPGDTAIPQE